MRACLILAFARTRRWLMVAGGNRKAEAMVAASKPNTAWRISGARMRRRSPDGRSEHEAQSLIRQGAVAPRIVQQLLGLEPQMVRRHRPAFRLRRTKSTSLRRATVSSQASGLSGMPRSASRAGPRRRPRTRRPRPPRLVRAGREIGDELAVACRATRRTAWPAGSPPRMPSKLSLTCRQTGRTSMEPCGRPGSGPPIAALRQGPAHRSCSSRRAAPWCRHRDRRAPWCRPRSRAPWRP